ncbi:OmpA family protein [Gallibacterium trehalosifermentans]|uniref:OmpA family protein n=1 Tax=Gallibacterium trehalosifermentans TaxID=516935 RepID=A0ABV6GXV0_9PAST
MKLKRLLLPVILSVVLSACGNLSDIREDGTTDKPIWPVIEKSNRGSWPNWTNVRKVDKNMSKAQIYDLIGAPHFNEGLFNVREWDYVFNYRQHGEHKICQFKVLFDKNMESQSLYWLPESCKNHQEYELSIDALFEFDSAKLKNNSKKIVQAVVQKLPKDQKVHITGYTDQLGSDAYNQKLSKARAESVKKYMVELGVPADQITTEGAGKTMAAKSCDNLDGKPLSELIPCLAPNRRIVISTN